MAARLPYTDGSDGHGLRDFYALLRHFRREPLSFYDAPFVESYVFLLTPEREAALLAVFDNEGSSAQTLLAVTASCTQGQPVAEVFKHIVRLRLRVFCRLKPGESVHDDDGRAGTLASVEMLMRDAAEAGQCYTLCIACTARERAGHAIDRLCRSVAAQLKEDDGATGWTPDNVVMACCSAVQLLRGRKKDASDRLAQKLERAKAAMKQAEDGGARCDDGRGCDSPACAAREPFAGAFKACGGCRGARYCSVVCQARAFHFLGFGGADVADVAAPDSPPQRSHWKTHKLTCTRGGAAS
jgi:hypothetical protein